jgi:hypothetical protein
MLLRSKRAVWAAPQGSLQDCACLLARCSGFSSNSFSLHFGAQEPLPSAEALLPFAFIPSPSLILGTLYGFQQAHCIDENIFDIPIQHSKSLDYGWWLCAVHFWDSLAALPPQHLYKRMALDACWAANTLNVKNWAWAMLKGVWDVDYDMISIAIAMVHLDVQCIPKCKMAI